MKPIYLAGRIVGWRLSSDEAVVSTIAESPMVYRRGGRLYVRGGDADAVRRLLDAESGTEVVSGREDTEEVKNAESVREETEGASAEEGIREETHRRLRVRHTT